MMRRACGVIAVIATAGAAHAQQNLGYRVLGGVGIDAGVQSPPGLYLAGRAQHVSSTSLRNREGKRAAVEGFDLSATAGVVGVVYIVKLPPGLYASFAVSVPVLGVSLDADDPPLSVRRSGAGDLYVQPLKLGGKWSRFDAVAGYGLFAPTGKISSPGASGGVGRGYWTQQLSAGGAAYFSKDKLRRASALVTYDNNTRRRNLDARRGNMLFIQGGAGTGVAGVATVGVAAYALRQISDDRGSAVPGVLLGARDRVYGFGPEIQLNLPKLGWRAEFRFTFDFGARSRPEMHGLAGGMSYLAWAPPSARSPSR